MNTPPKIPSCLSWRNASIISLLSFVFFCVNLLVSHLASLAHARIFTRSIREIEAAPREILHWPPPRERIVFAGNNAIWRNPAKGPVFLCFAFCYEKVTIKDIFEAVFIYAPIKISPCGCSAFSSRGRNLYRRMLNVCGAGFCS